MIAHADNPIVRTATAPAATTPTGRFFVRLLGRRWRHDLGIGFALGFGFWTTTARSAAFRLFLCLTGVV